MKEDEEYQEQDEIYYKNLPLWPKFDIYNKNVDGLIPSCYLTSWEMFHDVIKKYRDDQGAEYIFRGQHNYKWELQPTLDRMTPGAIQRQVADKQLKNFRLSIRGRVDNRILTDKDDEELWAIGQHHGLATPLLDWTLSPYVALFFAFLNEDPSTWVDDDGKQSNHSRVIYILNKAFIESLGIESDALEEGYPKIVEPSKDDHGRLVNQAGLFTMAPYGETLESSLIKALVESSIDIDIDEPTAVSQYICKLHLPNSPQYRRDCLRHLRDMNIHHASLFPDVIGASGHCNELINETIRSLNLKPNSLIPDNTQHNEMQLIGNKAEIQNLERILSKYTFNQILSEEIQQKDLSLISSFASDYLDTHNNVDWYLKYSEKSRLRNFLKNVLNKINFPKNEVQKATDYLSTCIAKISFERDEISRSADGTIIDKKVLKQRFDDFWRPN